MRASAPRRALVLLSAAAPPSPFEALRSAAAKGDPDAEFRLAQAFQLGKGVPKDTELAIMWYRRAVAQGHAQASDELGFLLFSHGDRRAAMPYVERAAARGDPRAFYLLGTAHFNGDFASRDWPLAYAQTSRAAEAGLEAARANLAMMDTYLLPPDRAKADSILATLPPVRRIVGRAPAATAPAPVPIPAPLPTPNAAPPAPPPPPVATAQAAPPTASRPTAPPASTGAWKIQLGAFGSADRASASWARLMGKVPALAAIDQRIVAAGAFQRLQGWGLASRTDAQALCGKVKAAGGDCLVLAP